MFSILYGCVEDTSNILFKKSLNNLLFYIKSSCKAITKSKLFMQRNIVVTKLNTTVK